MSDLHFEATIDSFEEHKQEFIKDIESKVKKYFDALGARRCLDLVEVEEIRNIDGSVTERHVEVHPFSFSWSFWTRLQAFMHQRDIARSARVRKYLDSAHTSQVERFVADRFGQLYSASREVADLFLQIQLQSASKRASLCSHVRELVRSSEMALSEQQLAAVSSLTDDEIICDVMQLDNDSGGESYMLAVTFLQEHLHYHPTELQPVTGALHLTMSQGISTMSQGIGLESRYVLFSFVRALVVNQLIVLLAEVLGVATAAASTTFLVAPAIIGILYSLVRLSSFPARLGGKIAGALANDLEKSFREKNREILKHLCLRQTDIIMKHLVETLVSSHIRAKIVDRIAGISTQSRKVLATKDTTKIEKLIQDDFYSISSGKYAWLKELKALGVSDEDMAELVLDEHDACPWIFYEEEASSEGLQGKELLLGHHLHDCAHRLQLRQEEGLLGISSPPSEADSIVHPSPYSFRNVEVATKLHRRCGLAGVAPISRNKESWNGFVTFDKDDTVALVSFAKLNSPQAIDPEHLLKRIMAALEGLCSAFAEAQDLNLCCSSYTAFCLKTPHDLPYIEAFRIQIEVAWQLLKILKSMLPNMTSVTLSLLSEKTGPLHAALQPLLGSHLNSLLHSEAGQETLTCLHFCSLAAQFLSLAFVSYSQAHRGGIFPSFLLKPLRKVVLSGAGMVGAPVIEMTTRSLTCIGDMLDAPVISFQLVTDAAELPRELSSKYNIYASLTDVVDTWGPAELLCASSDRKPFAIRIGGGILYTEDAERGQYHWSETVDMQKISRKGINPAGKLLIGAVHVNDSCQSNIENLRDKTKLGTLGTRERTLRLRIENIALSLGHYFSLSTQASLKYDSGISLKKVDRERAEMNVLSLLDDWSAVQVSYCTGICRRVKFRDMVADLLPAFGLDAVHSEDDYKSWQSLRDAGIMNHLRSVDHVTLEPSVSSFFERKVREMYKALLHSGIDDDQMLRVAWPSAQDRHAYSSIACGGQNSWVEILSESTWISTYAYIAPHCLQVEGSNTCSTGWSATQLSHVPAFVTKVRCLAPTSVNELPDKSICFFQTLRNIVFVQVCHPNNAPAVKLRVVMQTIPTSVRRRLFPKWPWRNKSGPIRLEENKNGSGNQADAVIIGCESST